MTGSPAPPTRSRLARLAQGVRARVPPTTPTFAFLGLGSNLGDRLAHLQHGVERLDADRRVAVDAVSAVYETAPVGGPPQEPYLNLAVRVVTTASPIGLLRVCARAERSAGRVRRERWGPRTLDVDVLLYGDRRVTAPTLTVPHPRLAERAFVLVPLVEVAPGAALPDGRRLVSLLAALAPIDGVTMVGRQVRVGDG